MSIIRMHGCVKCTTFAVMSLLLLPPPPCAIHTNINTSSSLPGNTGQLSLLLFSADEVRSTGRRLWRKRGGGGRVDSWADAAAPPGFAGDGLFPSHPAAVQLPRHQLSWWSYQTDQGLPLCGGWLKEWRYCGLTVRTSWHPGNTPNPNHHNHRLNLPGNAQCLPFVSTCSEWLNGWKKHKRGAALHPGSLAPSHNFTQLSLQVYYLHVLAVAGEVLKIYSTQPNPGLHIP